jgi:hypothetical protein
VPPELAESAGLDATGLRVEERGDRPDAKRRVDVTTPLEG